MDFTRRQQEILEIVRDAGFASVDRLAQHFDVTPQTIRRDVNLLCRESVLQRYHGGVGPASSVENLTYDARKRIGLSDKRRIARAVARAVPGLQASAARAVDARSEFLDGTARRTGSQAVAVTPMAGATSQHANESRPATIGRSDQESRQEGVRPHC